MRMARRWAAGSTALAVVVVVLLGIGCHGHRNTQAWMTIGDAETLQKAIDKDEP